MLGQNFICLFGRFGLQTFVMSWTNDVVLEFLDHYRMEQLLWDPKHPLHRNRSEINEAWHRIQNNLSINCSIIDLKRKKESLMTSFRLHYNRKKKASSEYRTTWFAYSHMESFLSGKYECDGAIKTDHEYFQNSTSYNQQPITDLNTIQNVGNIMNDKQNLNKVINRSTCPKLQTNSTEFVYQKRPVDNAAKVEMDEYELYGQLLAKKLRKLDEHQRDMVMHEIDNIMFTAKMQSGTTQARSYSSPPTPVPCL